MKLATMPLSETQLAEKRLESVARQIHQIVPKGIIRRILCPYCGAWNSHRKGSLLCCDLLRRAIVTILVADRALKAAEAGERSMQN